MSSPEVWDDALSRAQAAAAAQQLQVAEVGAQDLSDRNGMYLMFETAAQTADRIELSGQVWSEEGQVWIHVMSPAGNGARPALVVRKAMAGAFRFADDLPVGLVYLGCSFPPPETGEEQGNWVRFSLAVDYRYQDSASAVEVKQGV